jgi:hypothetical protein
MTTLNPNRVSLTRSGINVGPETAGNVGDHMNLGPIHNPSFIGGSLGSVVNVTPGPRVLGGRFLFQKKNPGSPGKLGRTSTMAESLSKLRGRGALA